jgi:hypothetical protein
MKFDIFGIFRAISLSATAPVTQNREARPQAEEPRLPEIDFALLVAIARPKTDNRVRTNARFTTTAGVNA